MSATSTQAQTLPTLRSTSQSAWVRNPQKLKPDQCASKISEVRDAFVTNYQEKLVNDETFVKQVEEYKLSMAGDDDDDDDW